MIAALIPRVLNGASIGRGSFPCRRGHLLVPIAKNGELSVGGLLEPESVIYLKLSKPRRQEVSGYKIWESSQARLAPDTDGVQRPSHAGAYLDSGG